MYRVSKQLWFCSAHQVRLSETECEAMHGHNYRVLVHAEARELDRTSYVIDFAELKKAAVEICGRFDHANINEVEPFREGERNPTAEELARFLCEQLGRRFDDARVRISKVEVYETDNNRAEWTPEEQASSATGAGRRPEHPEEQASPATGAGRRPEHPEEQASPATGAGRRPEHPEEQASPATGAGRKPEHQ